MLYARLWTVAASVYYRVCAKLWKASTAFGTAPFAYYNATTIMVYEEKLKTLKLIMRIK